MKPKIVELDNGKFAIMTLRFPKRFLEITGNTCSDFGIDHITESWVTGDYEIVKERFDAYNNITSYHIT